MARQLDFTAINEGAHYIAFGLNYSEQANFSVQLWLTLYGARMIDWCQAMSLNYVTFMGGDLWVHNSDTAPRANLFGEQKEVKVGLVVNEQANTVKLFDSLGIYSDGQWSVESVTIPPSLNKPSGMTSKIPIGRFKKRNGVLRAEFMRNLKSTTDTDAINEAISGEELKGTYAYLILKNENNPSGEQVKLFKVEVNLTTARG